MFMLTLFIQFYNNIVFHHFIYIKIEKNIFTKLLLLFIDLFYNVINIKYK